MVKDKKPLDNFSLDERQFFALIQLALGLPLDNCLEACKIDWGKIYQLADEHTLIGICLVGIEKFQAQCSKFKVTAEEQPETLNLEPGTVSPIPMDLLMEWLGQTEYIKTQNDTICRKAVELTNSLNKAGFYGVILKGCGIGQLYPQPELRTSGDIDIWIPNHSRKEILNYLRSTSGSKYMVYHNAEYPVFENVSVEVHFTPSWFWNPWRNKRFQNFCNECVDACLENKISLDAGEISVPTLRFNCVFILQHIYRHLFGEGIGLRQLLDYYFVLVKSRESIGERFWPQERIETMQRLKELGLERFTSAVMWIMKEVFGLSEECLLCSVNVKEGKYLLSEIMQGGNFGHYDERNKHTATTAFGRFWHHVKRDFRYIHSYPGEVLWVPVWKVWHFFWRKKFTE